MAETVQDLRMQPTTNGMKVCWSCVEKKPGGGTFDSVRYEPYEMVFKDGEEKEAMACFKEQKACMRKDSKEEEKSEK